jgi:hypothetical protein
LYESEQTIQRGSGRDLDDSESTWLTGRRLIKMDSNVASNISSSEVLVVEELGFRQQLL